VLSVVVMGIIFGGSGLISALLAAVMVLFFYGAGQYVMVRFADAGARTLLMVSMVSYTARIVILGLVLLLYSQHRADWPSLTPIAIFITTMAVVAGWLVLEVLVFSRLRIGAYDTVYKPPSQEESAP
jgi:ABC-type Fe3+ transport system permease subunit